MKQKNNKIKLYLLLITAAIFLSCEDKNYYDPDLENNNPLEITAPNGFDWQTIRSTSVRIEANDEFSGQFNYLIEVFDKNPVIDNAAQMMTNGIAKNNHPFTSQIALPNTTVGVYVRQTTPTGLANVRYATVTNGSINVSFKPESVANRSTRSTGIPDVNVPTIDPDHFPTEMPAIAQPIETSNWIPGGDNPDNPKVFYIDKSTPSSINIGPNVALYVIDDVNIAINPSSNMRIFVLPGKTLNLGGEQFLAEQTGMLLSIGDGSGLVVKRMTAGSDCYVLNKGTITVSETFNNVGHALIYNFSPESSILAESFRLENGQCLFVNDGQLSANEFYSADGATILNHNTVTITGKTNFQSSEPWINTGTWTTTTMESASTAMFYNTCQLIVTERMVHGAATLLIDAGAYLYAENIQFAGTIVQMGNGAYFHVGTLATFQWHNDNEGFKGTGESMALLKMGKAEVTGRIHYSGNIEIVCDDHTPNLDQYNPTYFLNAPAAFADPANNTVKIPATACNEGSDINPKEPDNKDPEPIVDPLDYSYLFEDLWPFYGDYDMNDAVILVNNITKNINTDGTIKSLSFDYTLKAVGAGSGLGAAIMLDEIRAADVSSVSYSTMTPSGFALAASGVESEQIRAVIPLFPDAHRHLGRNPGEIINTFKGASTNVSNPPTVKVTITFNAALNDTFDATSFNVFIISSTGNAITSMNRKEIHMIGYSPTQRADTSLFGNNDDRSTSGNYYRSRNNLSWAIVVPDKFRWPVELTSIREAYSGFANWVVTGGREDGGWWETPSNNDAVF